jgi:hypothetical protein
MKKKLEQLLKKFSSEIGPTLIATGIVNIDGGLEAYSASDTLGKGYKLQRSASIFAMIVNILNKTLCEIYEGQEEAVEEMLVTSKKSCFIVTMIESDNYFHGATFTIEGDIDKVREVIKKYKAEFAEVLTKDIET